MTRSGKTMRSRKIYLLFMALLLSSLFFISISFGLTAAVKEIVVNSTADSDPET